MSQQQTPQSPASSAEHQHINYAQILDHKTKMQILFGVLLGMFLSALDQTIVGTAMPRIISELQGLNLYTWVTTAYLLANTSMVPIYGKLSDLYGRKPVLMFGIVIFLIGSALCGMAGEPFLGNLFGGGMMQLVVFRGIQGLGGAALASVAFAIVADLFEPQDRPKYQGLFGAVFGLSSIAGPLLGGWLTDYASWRWVFYVNLPLGLLALVFLWFKMPVLKSGLKSTVDWLGAVLILVFTVPLLLALTWGADGNYAWSSPTILGLFGTSIAALIAFLFAESRHPSPVISLALFKNPTFAWGSLARFLFGGAFIGAILFLSLYLVQVHGVSATKAGLATLPLTFGLVIGAFGSGQLAARIGRYKPLMLIGLSVMILGFWWLSTLSADTSYSSVILRMVLLGFGIGPALPLYTTALQLSVKPWEIGVATSAGQFFQQLGSTIGVAVFGAILTTSLTHNLAQAFEAQAQAAQSLEKPAVAAQLGEIAAKIEAPKIGTEGAPDRNSAPQTPKEIQETFSDLRTQVTRAIEQGDKTALAALQKSSLPTEAKNQFAGISEGGLATSIKAQVNTTFDALERAVKANDYTRWQSILMQPDQSPALVKTLGNVPAAALQVPAPLLAQLEGSRARALEAAETVQADALQKALEGIDNGEQIALASTRATRVGFANTIAHIYLYCIGIAFLALLATLMMPNLSMKKTEIPHVEL